MAASNDCVVEFEGPNGEFFKCKVAVSEGLVCVVVVVSARWMVRHARGNADGAACSGRAWYGAVGSGITWIEKRS